MIVVSKDLSNGYRMEQLNDKVMRELVVIMDDGTEFQLREKKVGVLQLRATHPHHNPIIIWPVVSNTIEIQQEAESA